MYSLLSTDSYTLTQMFKSKEGGGGLFTYIYNKIGKNCEGIKTWTKTIIKRTWQKVCFVETIYLNTLCHGNYSFLGLQRKFYMQLYVK